MINRQTQTVALACPRCGSLNIVRDAMAQWDIEAQDWKLSGTLDDMNCEACERYIRSATERAVNHTLFNCLPGSAEPDWSLYDGLEINCCHDASEVSEESYIQTCSLHEAEFFTVYGHLKDGGVDAFTDCSTRKMAHAIAAVLSGFIEPRDPESPVLDCCSRGAEGGAA